MRIGVDASELFGERTGVGRYLAEILKRWTAGPTPTSHELVLFAPSARESAAGALHRAMPWLADARCQFQYPAGRPGTLWQQGALRRAVAQDRPDVFFAPAYTAPLLRRVPVVLALHDVSFAAHPEWFSWRHGLALRRLARLSALVAVEVLTLSDFSKREIVERLGVAPRRVRVVRPGISDRFGSPPGARRREPLVLFVGTLLNRRHLPDLVAGFGRLARRRADAKLAIVGANRTDPPEDPAAQAARLGISDRVTVTRYVSDETLTDLYGRARAFAFLSSYEGFALTPMEAMSMEVPAVLLDTPVAREVYGEAALYVPRGDLDAIATALGRLLDEPSLGRRLLQRAAPLVAEHTWAVAARRVMDALERAAQ